MNGFFKDSKTIERMTGGPLGQYVVDYALGLHAQGYTRLTGRRMLAMVAGFNQWLASNKIGTRRITSIHAKKYWQLRKRTRPNSRSTDRSALFRWLELLRQKGVIPQECPPRLTPCEGLIEEYDRHLAERSLSPGSRATYLPLVARFLATRFRQGPARLSSLHAADVIDYFRHRVKRLSGTRAQSTRTALRSFFQFARFRGDLTVDLGVFVPSVAKWSLESLPKSLPSEQVEEVLASCPRSSAVGRRAYAVLLLLARLGLRSAEVVNLMLDDIDWEKSRITIRGKMNRLDHLPMPADVGQAIAAYLKCDRPRVNTRRLFLLSKAPWSGFQTSSSIHAIVKDALAWAGIKSARKGAHQFRHSLACDMLRRGHLLTDIGEILRHRRPDTTAIYAKVDLLALRPLALPWPGGAR